MRVLRTVLFIPCCLLLVLIAIMRPPNSLAFGLFFGFILLLLGPLWPNRENVNCWIARFHLEPWFAEPSQKASLDNPNAQLKCQKITSWLIMVASIFACIGLLEVSFMHNFMPVSGLLITSVYVALALALGLFVFFLVSMADGYFVPGWNTFSKFKKLKIIFWFPIVMFGIFWLNFAYAIPYTYTELFGKSSIEEGTVVKVKHLAKKQCNYRLKPTSIAVNNLSFYFCVSEAQYELLPIGEIKAKLHSKYSVFGYIVKEIKL